MPKGDTDIKGNPELAAAKARLRKGTKNKSTRIKEALGLDRTERIIEQLDKNIDEFLHDTDKKTRLIASKSFADYYKPRKRELSGAVASNITLKFKY